MSVGLTRIWRCNSFRAIHLIKSSTLLWLLSKAISMLQKRGWLDSLKVSMYSQQSIYYALDKQCSRQSDRYFLAPVCTGVIVRQSLNFSLRLSFSFFTQLIHCCVNHPSLSWDQPSATPWVSLRTCRRCKELYGTEGFLSHLWPHLDLQLGP